MGGWDAARLRAVGRTGLTVAIAIVFGLVAHLAGIPGGLVMGGALGVSAVAVAGFKAEVADPARDVIFAMTGLIMGASVSPDSLELAGRWPISLALLLLELAVVVVVGGFALRRLFGFDWATAVLSLFPGNLALVAAVSATGLGNTGAIFVIQSVRVLFLAVLIPLVALGFAGDASRILVGPDASLQTLALISAISIAAGIAGERLRIPVGSLLVPMILVAAARVTGLFQGEVPEVLMILVLGAIGAVIGARFSSLNRDDLRGNLVPALVGTALILAAAMPFIAVDVLFTGFPFGQIWLAFAPGAIEGMGALGVALGFDPAFIAVHHVVRLIALTVAMPFVVRMLRGRT